MANHAIKSDYQFATISEMSVRYRVTFRALRFYEQRGLLHPERVGVQRFYSPADRIRLQFIQTGKKMGFSLREIQALIETQQAAAAAPETPGLVNALDAVTIARQVALLEQRKAIVEAAIIELSAAVDSYHQSHQ